jgi:hypothetical protein
MGVSSWPDREHPVDSERFYCSQVRVCDIVVCEWSWHSEGGLQVFIGIAQSGVSEVLSLRLASGPGAKRTGCRSKELSVESDSWDSAAVFCIHYCFNYCICSVNKHCYLLEPGLICYSILWCLCAKITLTGCASNVNPSVTLGFWVPTTIQEEEVINFENPSIETLLYSAESGRISSTKSLYQATGATLES